MPDSRTSGGHGNGASRNGAYRVARLPEHLAEALRQHPQSGLDYWIVVARLWDGREVGGVAIIDDEIVQTSDRTPMRPSEIVDLGLEGGRWLIADDDGTHESRARKDRVVGGTGLEPVTSSV